MAKARKKARKPAAKKTKRKTVKRKAKRAAPPKQQGVISSAVQTVTEAMGLRSKLEGRNTFED